MAANIYDIGDEVILQGTFRNRDGTLTTPDDVTVAIEEPDGTTTAIATSTASTGVIEASFTTSQAGDHHYLFVSTDNLEVAGEEMFHVRDRQVTLP